MDWALVNADEGYQFGLGVFETIAVHGGRPVLFDEHMRRLANGLRFLGLDGAGIAQTDAPVIDVRTPDGTRLPLATRDEAAAAVRGLARNGQAAPMRVLALRAVGMAASTRSDGTSSPVPPAPSCALKIMVSDANLTFAIRANPYDGRDPEQAMRLIVADVRRNETSPLTWHKTFGQGDNILTTRAAKARGFDGALLLNTRGEIAETTVANIFFARRTDAPGLSGVRVVTPAHGCGLLPGTMRAWVMSDEVRRIGLAVDQERLTLDDLAGYDECFVTNALMGVLPVASIEVPDRGTLTFPRRGVARALREQYARLTR